MLLKTDRNTSKPSVEISNGRLNFRVAADSPKKYPTRAENLYPELHQRLLHMAGLVGLNRPASVVRFWAVASRNRTPQRGFSARQLPFSLYFNYLQRSVSGMRSA